MYCCITVPPGRSAFLNREAAGAFSVSSSSCGLLLVQPSSWLLSAIWITEPMEASRWRGAGGRCKCTGPLVRISFPTTRHLNCSWPQHQWQYCSYLEPIVNLHFVECIAHNRSLARQQDPVGGTSFDFAESFHTGNYVGVAIEGESHLLGIVRPKFSIQWQDVEYLVEKTHIQYTLTKARTSTRYPWRAFPWQTPN